MSKTYTRLEVKDIHRGSLVWVKVMIYGEHGGVSLDGDFQLAEITDIRSKTVEFTLVGGDNICHYYNLKELDESLISFYSKDEGLIMRRK